MGFEPVGGMIQLPLTMSRRTRMLTGYLAALLLAGPLPPRCEAKSYSSGGGHSYSSSHSSSSGGGHSFSSGSHSFSSGSSRSSGSGSTRTPGSSSSGSHNSSSVAGASKSSGTSASRNSSSASDGSKSFKSSSGKSYNSGSSWSENDRRGYSSTKSYTSGAGHKFPSSSGSQPSVPTPVPPNKPAPSPAPASFAFDTAAAHAKKEEASKQDFTRFKEAQTPRAAAPSPSARSTSDSPAYRVKAPPISSSDGLRRPRAYIPDVITLSSRPVRIYNVFNPYYSRPVVIYRDPYDSFFWWWLLDRTLDERAWWAYHHRYDMD